MKNSLLFLIFLCLFIFNKPAISQENFISGYIITPGNDTIFGFIDYQNWGINPKQVVFKNLDSIESKTYAASEIQGFFVNNEMYTGAIVDVEVSPRETGSLDFYPDLNLKQDTVFLMALVSRNKSLYYLNTLYSAENFYIEENGKILLLVYKRYTKNISGKPVVTENNSYVGQLTYYLRDNDEVREKIRTTIYTKKSLVNLFMQYFENQSSHSVYVKEKEKISTEYGLLLGGTLTTLRFKETERDIWVEKKCKEGEPWTPSKDLTGGVFLNLLLPRNMDRFSISNELLLTSCSFYNEYFLYVHEDLYYSNRGRLEYLYLKLNTMVRYQLKIENFTGFIKLGFSNSPIIKSHAKLEVNKTFHNVFSAYDYPFFKSQNIKKWDHGLIIGTGMSYKKFHTEIRFEPSVGFSKRYGEPSNVRRYYFIMGYTF